MNVYDFDNTIYSGDSSVDFYKYTLKKFPKVIKFWPEQLKAGIDYRRGKIGKTEMKTIFYKYFTEIPDMNSHLEAFWDEHEKNIQLWYLEQRQDDDLIISASPEFFLEPMAKRLDVDLIASIVDPRTGRNLRSNCHGPEKVRRMKEKYRMNNIDEFYSDCYSDDPLAQYARESFYVKKNSILPW